MISFLRALLIRTLHASLRVKHVRVAKLQSLPQYILAFWHAHLLLMLHAGYRRPIRALISQSKDGELIASTFKHYGVDSVRGSSTRGGATGLREMIRIARGGENIAITPDGPKGPPRIVKDGVIYAAQASGLPIAPVAFAAKKKSCCTPGTGWLRRTHSHARSSFTAIRSRYLGTRTSKNGACVLSGR